MSLRGRARRLWPAAVLAALVFLVLSRLLTGGLFLFDGDVALVWVPQAEVFARAVTEGAWPVWDPAVAFGHPLLANPNRQVFYPTTWLLLWMKPWRLYSVYVGLHVLLAAAGGYLLARHRGVSRAGALTAAACFAASGPLLSLAIVWHHLAGAAWMPWVLLAGSRALDRPTLRRVLLWAAAATLQLFAGSPDMLVFTGALIAVELVRRVRPGRVLLRRNGRLVATAGAAALVAAALGAAQWMPTFELLGQAHRWSTSVASRATWSLHPFALPQLLLPLSFESLPDQATSPAATAALFELWQPFLRNSHLGLTAAALVVAAACGRHGRRARLPAALSVAWLLFALGRTTPVFGLVSALPGFSMLRYPDKAMVPLALAWALLAGHGVDALRTASPRLRALMAGILATLAVVGWAAFLGGTRSLGGPFSRTLGAGGPTWAQILGTDPGPLAFSAALASLALLAVVALRARGAAPLVIGALAAAELVMLGRDLNLLTVEEFYDYEPPLVQAVGDGARLYVWDYILRVPGRGHPSEGMVAVFMDVPSKVAPAAARELAMVTYLYPPSAARFGLRGSYDRDLLGFYDRYLADATLVLRAVEDTPAYVRLLQAGAVSDVVALHTEEQPDLVPVVVPRGPYRRPIQLFRVPGTLPRTYAVGGWRADRGVGVSQVLEPSLDLRREAVVAGIGDHALPSGFTGTSRIVSERADRVVLEVDVSAAAIAVLVDGFAPGWSAQVDGRSAPVLRVNALFRGVAVEAGKHTVELAYRPRSVIVGLGISAAALLGVIAAAITRARPRARPRG